MALLLLFAFSALAIGQETTGPGRLVRLDEQAIRQMPLDDGDRQDLLQSLEASRRYLQRQQSAQQVTWLPVPLLLRTLKEFEALARKNFSASFLPEKYATDLIFIPCRRENK